MAKVELQFGELGGGINPIIDSISVTAGSSSYAYVNVPKKPKYISAIWYVNSTTPLYVMEYDGVNDTYMGSYTSVRGAVTPSSALAWMEVNDDKIGFKTPSGWQGTSVAYTFCF